MISILAQRWVHWCEFVESEGASELVREIYSASNPLGTCSWIPGSIRLNKRNWCFADPNSLGHIRNLNATVAMSSMAGKSPWWTNSVLLSSTPGYHSRCRLESDKVDCCLTMARKNVRTGHWERYSLFCFFSSTCLSFQRLIFQWGVCLENMATVGSSFTKS